MEDNNNIALHTGVIKKWVLQLPYFPSPNALKITLSREKQLVHSHIRTAKSLTTKGF